MPPLWNDSQRIATFIPVVAGTRGAGSRHGVDRTVLEAGMGSTGRTMPFTSGAGEVQPWAAGPQDGFSGRQTDCQPASFGRPDSQLCAGTGAALLAHPHAD